MRRFTSLVAFIVLASIGLGVALFLFPGRRDVALDVYVLCPVTYTTLRAHET
jgi:hypothetical protein